MSIDLRKVGDCRTTPDEQSCIVMLKLKKGIINNENTFFAKFRENYWFSDHFLANYSTLKKHIYYTFFEKHLNDLKIYSTAQFDNETRIIIHQIIALWLKLTDTIYQVRQSIKKRHHHVIKQQITT